MSRELDTFSDYGNLNVMLGDGNSNSIERELDSLIKVPEGQRDFRSFPNRENYVKIIYVIRIMRSAISAIETRLSGKKD